MTYAKEFTYMEKTAADIGVPYLNKATVEYTMTQKFTTTTTNTATVTSTVSYSLQQQIPPLTMQQVTANASAGMITVKVSCKLILHRWYYKARLGYAYILL